MNTKQLPLSLALSEPLLRPGDHNSRYFNRELSWIDFNRRVLEEAVNPDNPLLERLKFLAIFASNLDEFFMIRVSGIKQQIAAGVQKRSPDGMTPTEQLAAIRRMLLDLVEQEHVLVVDHLVPELATEGIRILNYHELQLEQKAFLEEYFRQQIFPVLTPLAFDTSRPFPHISNLSLSLAVVMHHATSGEVFARVKVPEVLPRFIMLPRDLCDGSGDIPPERRACFVYLEQVIAAHLETLFPGMDLIASYPFRVIRNADMEIEEDEAHDLLLTIEQGVRQRRFGEVVRITVNHTMPAEIRHLLVTNLNTDPDDIYTVRGPLGLSALMELMKLDRPDLKDPPFYSGVPSVLEEPNDLFAAIRHQDILLHHPYDSFEPVIDLIERAADDPDVLAIKQTLYRVGKNSPIVQALMRACEQGKQVAVLVELKARFDEENNIIWARALERVGVHVVYGLLRLKTHAKLALIVRREEGSIRRYAHLGTGNYNASTARLYTDLGLLTCRPDIAADVSELFNVLTGYSYQRHYRKLLVAPAMLRNQMISLIDREMRVHQKQGNGAIIFKMNSLVDPAVIDALYRASQAGVQVDLIIRGICCLRPGVPGLSEHIQVRSIVGRFLEHNRIYYFRNGGNDEVYLGSADMMQRNLDRRVETLFPVEEPVLVAFIRDTLLASYLQDNLRTRVLQSDGSYIWIAPAPDEEHRDSQVITMGYHTVNTGSMMDPPLV
ncbi:MAG: polyphosphate kinase 1 [Chloroflexaceae bacterium]|nr:polyphosphate kinase 1 [Chloroflexaceae bacterium]